MKKTFKTFALMLLTAFAFSSCVDVPAPFNVPDKSSTPDGPATPEGIPATCAQAVELTNALSDGATSAETYAITGYITEVVGEVSRNQQTRLSGRLTTIGKASLTARSTSTNSISPTLSSTRLEPMLSIGLRPATTTT